MNGLSEAVSIHASYIAWIIQAHMTTPFLTWSIFYGNMAKQDNLKCLRQFAKTAVWKSAPVNKLTRIPCAKSSTAIVQIFH